MNYSTERFFNLCRLHQLFEPSGWLSSKKFVNDLSFYDVPIIEHVDEWVDFGVAEWKQDCGYEMFRILKERINYERD